MKLSNEQPQNESQGQQAKTQTALQSLVHRNTGLTSEPLNYEDVSLTDEEKEEALREARRKKHFVYQREEYRKRLNEEWKLPVFTSEMVYDILQKAQTYNGKRFILNADPSKDPFSKIAFDLCHYFTGDDRFSGDRDKGLALLGNLGTGKTALMRFFMKNPVSSFRVKSILDITDGYKQSGETAVRLYNYNLDGVRNEFDQAIFGLCIDEVGIEQIPAPHYGEQKNVFAEVIQMRSLNVAPHTTHITSNLQLKDFEGMYGSRVYDRMKEMFNVIVFNKINSFRQ